MVPPRANLPWHYKRPLVCQTDRNTLSVLCLPHWRAERPR